MLEQMNAGEIYFPELETDRLVLLEQSVASVLKSNDILIMIDDEREYFEDLLNCGISNALREVLILAKHAGYKYLYLWS